MTKEVKDHYQIGHKSQWENPQKHSMVSARQFIEFSQTEKDRSHYISGKLISETM